MTSRLRDESAEILRFGGGRNSRASEDQINPVECTDGENFTLDPGNGEFRAREPYDLVGTAPNGSEIRGFVTLRKTDGTVSMLVQAGATVYEWDGSNFISRGTVAATAQLRGQESHFWALADKVLISDLNLAEEIHEWDGTTFQQTSFFDADGSTAFGNFRCKYIVIDKERALYGNIYESAANFPHLLVGSQQGDYTVVSAGIRPSSSLGEDSPWFLPTPQLKPINGMAEAFNIVAISQENGDFEKLVGENAKEFELQKLHPDSGALGDEAVVSTGNDVIYGAAGHIESLQSTEKFGDVEFDDLSFKIKDDINTFDDWTLVHNPRVRRIYCFPDGGNEVHVLFRDFIGTELSPWSKYITSHSFSFQPTAAMTCRDPIDGLQYVFMGDSAGNVYKMEGSGESGDAGSADIEARRVSLLFQAPLDTKAIDINGWVKHRKQNANTLNLRLLYSGKHVHDVQKDVTLSAVVYDTPYNGSVYYGGSFYYGPNQENRLVTRTWAASGEANGFQVETKVVGSKTFAIQEVGVRYDYAGPYATTAATLFQPTTVILGSKLMITDTDDTDPISPV